MQGIKGRVRPFMLSRLMPDMTSRRVKTKAGIDEAEKRRNRTKARVRAKVEWPFRIIKRVFGFTKVRYRGLKKNHEWLCGSLRWPTSTSTVNDSPGSTCERPLWGRSMPAGGCIRLRRTNNHETQPQRP